MSETSFLAEPEPVRLVVDAGNTNIAFAIYTGDRRRGTWRISTNSRRTGDEYAVWLSQLMALEGLRPSDVEEAVVGSVVPGVTDNLRFLCTGYFGGLPLIVGEGGIRPDVTVRLDRPDDVGADRLVNALAVHESYPGPTIVVDFGTATTFDVIAADGAYEGGIIAPGIHASMDALYSAAAKLPGVSVQRPDRVIGKSTVSAIQSGVFWGYIGLIEGLLTRIANEHGGEPTVVGTGGLAPMFEPETKAIHYVDSDLTLRGLLRVAQAHGRRRSGSAPRNLNGTL